jgi:hypothetical protein
LSIDLRGAFHLEIRRQLGQQMAYTYTRKSTIDDLKREGFFSLQFECQSCTRKEAIPLSDFASHLSYEVIFSHGAACVACAKKTHYLTPLRQTEACLMTLTRNVSPQIDQTAATKIGQLATKLEKTSVAGGSSPPGSRDVIEELNKLIEDQAELSAKSATIHATGRRWSALTPQEQSTLTELEKRKLYMHALKKVGWGIALITGIPTFF